MLRVDGMDGMEWNGMGWAVIGVMSALKLDVTWRGASGALSCVSCCYFFAVPSPAAPLCGVLRAIPLLSCTAVERADTEGENYAQDPYRNGRWTWIAVAAPKLIAAQTISTLGMEAFS